MAITHLDPGGDATFNIATSANGGFWRIPGTNTLATDFVHGGHIKSMACTTGYANSRDGICADAGTRISFWIYITAYAASSAIPFNLQKSGDGVTIVKLNVNGSGVMQLLNSVSTQLGSNGTTLALNTWYRICIAYTVSSTTVNSFRVFVNGAPSISATNVTIVNTISSGFSLGNYSNTATFSARFSDIYVDNSSSLTDTGNIWVTAKRPNANGTTNGFTTQIGSGGSSYGTGHSPQVNERPASQTNGWSMIGAGSAITEEYNIETASVGDIDISKATIVGYVGWLYGKSAIAENPFLIIDGASSTQLFTTSAAMYIAASAHTTYPAGTGADIGIQTDTSITTVSLYECGVIVAYIPTNRGFFII